VTTSVRVRSLLEIGVLALVAWLAASALTATARLLAHDVPESGTAASVDAAPSIEPLDAFRSIATRDVFNGDRAATAGPRLALRLWGIGMHGARAYAVIEDTAGGEQRLVGVGDEVGDARVAEIAWDQVTLRRPGGDETLALTTEPASSASSPSAPHDVPPAAVPADPAIRQTSPDAYIVDRTALTGAVDNTSGLLTQLRAVPEVSDGRPVGFRLLQMKRDSVFTRLGLRDGDVVQRVNGTTLADPASLLGFLQRLKDEPRVALDIVRGGQARTLVYDLR
jgi:general secretion pathway protein C